jgi:lysophospholipase L1-like esterase
MSRRPPAGHWSWDGVHPHYAGHALMAREMGESGFLAEVSEWPPAKTFRKRT